MQHKRIKEPDSLTTSHTPRMSPAHHSPTNPQNFPIFPHPLFSHNTPFDPSWNGMASLMMWKQQALLAYYSIAMSSYYKDDPLFQQKFSDSPFFINSLHKSFPPSLARKSLAGKFYPENPVDLTNNSHVYIKKSYHSDVTSDTSYENLKKQPTHQVVLSGALQNKKTGNGGKKLVGIRFLFPPFPDHVSLYDRAKIWVARHEHKYFVDWTADDLVKADPKLRPLYPITRQQYKIHMNRSEYCRNVKLKYCLQTKAPWAEEFCMRLQKSPAEGGFTGLCQAKIAAADLWRTYSENYRSHQARQPNKHKRTQEQSMTTNKTSDLLEGAKRLKVDFETKVQPLHSLTSIQQHCKRIHDLMRGKTTLEALHTDATKRSAVERVPHKGIWSPFDDQQKIPFHKYSINGILADINNNYEEERREMGGEVVSGCDSTTDHVKCERVEDEDVVVDVDCEDEKPI